MQLHGGLAWVARNPALDELLHLLVRYGRLVILSDGRQTLQPETSIRCQAP